MNNLDWTPPALKDLNKECIFINDKAGAALEKQTESEPNGCLTVGGIDIIVDDIVPDGVFFIVTQWQFKIYKKCRLLGYTEEESIEATSIFGRIKEDKLTQTV